MPSEEERIFYKLRKALLPALAMLVRPRVPRQPRKYPPGQWHRWYKVNHRHQRQLRALKQIRGGRINPKVTGLLRSMVR